MDVLPRQTTREVRAVIAPTTTFAKPQAIGEPTIRVDLNELTVRIASYNSALSGLCVRLQEVRRSRR